MKKITYLMVFATMLVFNANAEQAADSKPNALPVIERSVVTVAARPADGSFIKIPRAALTARNGIPGVFVVEKNEARFRMVRPGKTGAAKLDIFSGLFGDEILIIGELEAVHDGSPIIIIKKIPAK